MNTVPIYQLARTLRSKNAGSHFLTFEIIFSDPEIYRRVKESGAVSLASVAETYNIAPSRITHFVFYDPGLAIKATIRRPLVSGSPGESDVYGCQQYAPLFDLKIPWDGELPALP